MDITASKDPVRVLKNAVMGFDGITQLEPGTRIVYHRGKIWSLSETNRKIGEMARLLMELKRVILVQRKIGVDDYEWIAVVRTT